MIKKIFFKFFKHELLQTKLGRKWYGKEIYYYMQTMLPMCPFWSERKFSSCQAVCLKEEINQFKQKP